VNRPPPMGKYFFRFLTEIRSVFRINHVTTSPIALRTTDRILRGTQLRPGSSTTRFIPIIRPGRVRSTRRW
jgi:hypothetical protein